MQKAKFADRYRHIYRDLRVNPQLVIVDEIGNVIKLHGTYAPRNLKGKERIFYVLKEKIKKNKEKK